MMIEAGMKNFAYLLAAALGLLLGCGDLGVNVSMLENATPLDASINGKLLSAHVDEWFVLRLVVEFDAGYQWDWSISDRSVIDIDSVSYQSNTHPPADGGSATESFYFRIRKEGRSTVQLIQHRAWEPTVPPIETMSFVVDVH